MDGGGVKHGLVIRVSAVGAKCKYEAGDYVWVNIPAIHRLQWHPFSITSAPTISRKHSTQKITFHIQTQLLKQEQNDTSNQKKEKESSSSWRQLKDWMRNITGTNRSNMLNRNSWTIQLASKALSLQRRQASLPSPPSLLPALTIHLDGPHGHLSRRLPHPLSHYPILLFIANGIGITPFLSLLAHYLYLDATEQMGRVRRVHLVWIVKSEQVVRRIEPKVMEPVLRWSEREEGRFRVHLFVTGEARKGEKKRERGQQQQQQGGKDGEGQDPQLTPHLPASASATGVAGEDQQLLAQQWDSQRRAFIPSPSNCHDQSNGVELALTTATTATTTTSTSPDVDMCVARLVGPDDRPARPVECKYDVDTTSEGEERGGTTCCQPTSTSSPAPLSIPAAATISAASVPPLSQPMVSAGSASVSLHVSSSDDCEAGVKCCHENDSVGSVSETHIQMPNFASDHTHTRPTSSSSPTQAYSCASPSPCPSPCPSGPPPMHSTAPPAPAPAPSSPVPCRFLPYRDPSTLVSPTLTRLRSSAGRPNWSLLLSEIEASEADAFSDRSTRSSGEDRHRHRHRDGNKLTSDLSLSAPVSVSVSVFVAGVLVCGSGEMMHEVALEARKKHWHVGAEDFQL